MTSFADLDAGRPPLPPETCPMIDRLWVLAHAIAGDLEVVREGLARSRSSIARTAGDELLDSEANLASLRLQLDDLRAMNEQLRSSVRYWRDGAKALSKGTDHENN